MYDPVDIKQSDQFTKYDQRKSPKILAQNVVKNGGDELSFKNAIADYFAKVLEGTQFQVMCSLIINAKPLAAPRLDQKVYSGKSTMTRLYPMGGDRVKELLKVQMLSVGD